MKTKILFLFSIVLFCSCFENGPVKITNLPNFGLDIKGYTAYLDSVPLLQKREIVNDHNSKLVVFHTRYFVQNEIIILSEIDSLTVTKISNLGEINARRYSKAYTFGYPTKSPEITGDDTYEIWQCNRYINVYKNDVLIREFETNEEIRN